MNLEDMDTVNDDDNVDQGNQNETNDPVDNDNKDVEEQQSSTQKALEEMGIVEGEENNDQGNNESDDSDSDNDENVDPDPKQPVQIDKKEEQQPQARQSEEPKQLTEDEEEALVLAGVKSERGRERLQRLLTERKESRAQVEAFSKVVQGAGLDQESFANLMEISRLCSSGNQQEVEQGLKALESVRANLYKSLGREAPGIDLLEGYDDLQSKVKDLNLDRNDALAIAKARNEEAQRKAMQAQQQQAWQQQQATITQINEFSKVAQQQFESRSKEVDFEAKVEKMKEYFSKPGAIDNFVRSYRPEQWAQTLMFMYDNMAVAPQTHRQPAPITQRRARQEGFQSGVKSASPEGVMARIEQMGLI